LRSECAEPGCTNADDQPAHRGSRSPLLHEQILAKALSTMARSRCSQRPRASELSGDESLVTAPRPSSRLAFWFARAGPVSTRQCGSTSPNVVALSPAESRVQPCDGASGRRSTLMRRRASAAQPVPTWVALSPARSRVHPSDGQASSLVNAEWTRGAVSSRTFSVCRDWLAPMPTIDQPHRGSRSPLLHEQTLAKVLSTIARTVRSARARPS
jgi:hypothetical protein